MCRMAAVKSKTPVAPVLALRMMLAMQKGNYRYPVSERENLQ